MLLRRECVQQGACRLTQADGVPAPIAAVVAAAAAGAVVAILSLSPAGISLTLCVKVLAAAITSLKVR